MSTHNIHFRDKIRKVPKKYPYIFVILSYRRSFLGTQERVRIIHGKQDIRVQAIEVLLYMATPSFSEYYVQVFLGRNQG